MKLIINQLSNWFSASENGRLCLEILSTGRKSALKSHTENFYIN